MSELISIEKISLSTGVPELVAEVPFLSGTYPTESGDLKVQVCPEGEGVQKVIFSGDVIPTIQKRGNKRQFHRIPKRRRVVEFSQYPSREIRQDLGVTERLVFRKYINDLQKGGEEYDR